jgi:hypothetical protein
VVSSKIPTEKDTISTLKDILENSTQNNNNQFLLTLTDSNFTKYVKNRPRKYHAVIILSVATEKFKCDICPVCIIIHLIILLFS